MLDLYGLRLHIPSPSYDMPTVNAEGRGGVIVLEKTLQPRSITAEFFTKSNSYIDSLKLRDELYALLGNGNQIYIAESHNPIKRWKVHVEGWSPDRIARKVFKFEIPLLAEMGVAESINVIEKRFINTSFTFRNEGSIVIDPRQQRETEITFKGVSNGLTIHNLTTGDVWTYNGSTVAEDVITLKSVRSLKNDVSIFGQTNKRLLTFAPGNNEIKISGTSGDFELTIRTRFYFL